MKFFNTAGPVNPADHYCLDPLARINLPELETLIGQKKYFILHAPRQTGKTSSLLALMEHLNRSGRYRALYANVEVGQSAREDVQEGMRAILSSMASWSRTALGDGFLEATWPEVLAQAGGHDALKEVLVRWCRQEARPVVLFLDEIDALVGDTLIAVLRQLRAGYTQRPAAFPQSVILCGVRDVRDYRIHSDREKAIITGGSAFNIKAKALVLGNFTREEVAMLYQQHTEATGQAFTEEAKVRAWELTAGQPWLVNALAYEACFEMPAGRDRGVPVTAEMLEAAKENLISRRETHLDQLADKLREERVRRVVEPILAGSLVPDSV
ncbi:MAG: ATP-binding protein, partial [Thermodesulfobacteriota bacterium]